MKKLKEQEPSRSPWLSGSFYLAACVVITAAMLAVGRLLPWYSVAIAIIGAILGIVVVGAFQLAQDRKLSQKNFLELMGLTFRALLLLRGSGKGRHEGADRKSQDDSD